MTNDMRLPFQKLDVYVTAKEIARRVHAARIRDAELRDQAAERRGGDAAQVLHERIQ